jgi:hypothetical protein
MVTRTMYQSLSEFHSPETSSDSWLWNPNRMKHFILFPLGRMDQSLAELFNFQYDFA